MYVGSRDNRLYALDASTGDLLWRYETGGDVDSSPAVSGGVVYVGSDDDHLYAIAASLPRELPVPPKPAATAVAPTPRTNEEGDDRGGGSMAFVSEQ